MATGVLGGWRQGLRFHLPVPLVTMPRVGPHHFELAHVASWNHAWSLWRWEQRANLRLLRFQLLSTLLGRLNLLAALASLVPVWRLLTRGLLTPLPLTPAAENGALAIAHAFAVAYCCVVTVGLRATVLQRHFTRDPLRAHGDLAPVLRLYRAGVGIVGFVALMPTGTLALMFGDIVAARPGGVVRLASYAAACLCFFSVLSMLIFVASTRVPAARLAIPGSAALRLLALATAAVHIGMVFVPVWLAGRHARVLEAVGLTAGRVSGALQLPLTVALPDPIPILPVAIAAVAIVIAAWQGWLGLLRWSRSEPPPDAEVDLEGQRRHPSAFSGIRRSAHVPTLLRVFWTKDVILASRRSPWQYAQQHWFLLASTVGGLIAAVRLPTPLPGGLMILVQTLLVLMCAGAIAAPGGLGSLGREGRQFHMLRAVISPSVLFGLKAHVNGVYAASHAIAHALLLTTIGAALGIGVGWTPGTIVCSALLAGGAGAAFATLATGMGFLLPVFEPGPGVLSGVSRVSLAAYLLIVATVSSVMALAWTWWLLGSMGLAAMAIVQGGGLAASTGLGVLLAVWGIRRMGEME